MPALANKNLLPEFGAGAAIYSFIFREMELKRVR
jgi:hypothetical protein